MADKLSIRTDLAGPRQRDAAVHAGDFVQSPSSTMSDLRTTSDSASVAPVTAIEHLPTPSLPSALSQQQRYDVSSRLARVRELHELIANEHLSLETRDVKGWQHTLNSARSQSQSHSGDGQQDKHDNGKAYESIAEQASKRQDGIQSITNKLDELSTVLRELHSIPPPVLFPQQSASMSNKRLPATPTKDLRKSKNTPRRQSAMRTGERRSSFG